MKIVALAAALAFACGPAMAVTYSGSETLNGIMLEMTIETDATGAGNNWNNTNITSATFNVTAPAENGGNPITFSNLHNPIAADVVKFDVSGGSLTFSVLTDDFGRMFGDVVAGGHSYRFGAGLGEFALRDGTDDQNFLLGSGPITLTATNTLAAVPLPLSALLLLSGVGGLSIAARRKASA